MKVFYEWVIEEADEAEDIFNTCAYNTVWDALCEYMSLPDEPGFKSMVLVRDEFDNEGYLLDRGWAYVSNMSLPDYFSNFEGHMTELSVPKKYKEAFNKAVEKWRKLDADGCMLSV